MFPREWTTLYKIGGIAALAAALLFRRNIGAEVSLFSGVAGIPTTAAGWYGLLQGNPLVGLALLAFFDIINYALEGLVFLALAVALWQARKSSTLIALASGLVGIVLSFASNISLTMFSFSLRYAAAAAEEQKAALLAAGQSLLASRDPLAGYPDTGAYLSLLFIALAGLLFSVNLLAAHRAAGITGLLASGCDLAYCLTFGLTASLPVYLLLAAAGLFWMIWHLLVSRILLQHARKVLS